MKETSGLWIGSPEWKGGCREFGPQESSRRLALDDECAAELVSENAKNRHETGFHTLWLQILHSIQ